MDLKRPTTTTEAQALIGMLQYYMNMYPMWSHISAPLKEADRGSKGRKIIWNDPLEYPFKEINRMVSDETLLIYPYWKITFTVNINDSDKQLGAVIRQNNKPIEFF